MSVKGCRDCGQEKPATEFHRSKSSPDGLAYYCKGCSSLRNAKNVRRRAAREGREMRPFPGQRQSVPAGMKRCPDCRQNLAVEAFPRNKSTKDGRASYCKPCQNNRSRESRERVHGGSRHYHLKRRYGLGADEVEARIKAQGGVCLICRKPDPEHVDHDHATGRVRAVLCFNCNGGLGQFKDNPVLLRRAADYLEGIVWKPMQVGPGDSQQPS